MKKSLIIIIILLSSISGICQQKVSEHEAVFCAIRAMETRGYENFQTKGIEYDISSRGDTLMFEVMMDNGYDVLISGVKTCIPVLAVFKNNIEQSIFTQTEYHVATSLVSLFRKMIEDNMPDNGRQNNLAEWETLLDTSATVMPLRAPSHLLTSKWGENASNDGIDMSAYNEECPNINNCLAPAGSASVAMGQLMYYWNYPFFSLNDGQVFNWCNMGDDLITTDDCYYTKKKNIDILLNVCGIKTYSNYSCSYTYTSPDNVLNALWSYFKYYSANDFDRQPYTPDPNHPEYAALFQNFWDKIEDDIDDYRPIIGYLKDEDEKYYFVCDGYQNNYYVHMNWGITGSHLNGDYSIFLFQLMNFYLFGVAPQIIYSVGTHLNLSDYYALCASQIGSTPLYKIVPNTSDTLISASLSSNSSWRTIPAGATALYQAHVEVNLEDGFEAESGSDFEVRIEPCEQCDEQRDAVVTEDYAQGVGSDTLSGNDTIRAKRNLLDMAHSGLFPNPTDGPLTMATDGMAEAVFIHDLAGRPMGGWHLDALTETFVTLDVSALRPGTYLLTVVIPSGTVTKKLLVQ